MKKIIKNIMTTTLSVMTIASMLIYAPMLAKAKNNAYLSADVNVQTNVVTNDDNDAQNSFVPPGHYIAPGLIGKISLTINEAICNMLPKGISKKIGFCGNLPVDTTRPVISNISVNNITNNSADIRWSTNESSRGTVYYGKTSGFSIEVASTLSSSIGIRNGERKISLSDLDADTTYYFSIKAEDRSGNTSMSSEMSFKTAKEPGSDTTAPVISNILISEITMNSAVVSWKTNEPATSMIWYSSSSPINKDDASKVKIDSRVLDHSFKISGLSTDTKYYVIVGGSDLAGNKSESAEQSFTTLKSDTTAPLFMSIAIVNTTDISTGMFIHANEPVKVSVTYGVAGISNTKIVSEDTLAADHTMAIVGLTANTNYTAKVKITDKSGNMTESDTVSWKTSLDIKAPVISNVSVSTSLLAKEALISWKTDEQSDSRVSYSTTSTFDSVSVVSSGKMVTNHELKLGGLTAESVYYYKAESTDASGNTSTSLTGIIFIT